MLQLLLALSCTMSSICCDETFRGKHHYGLACLSFSLISVFIYTSLHLTACGFCIVMQYDVLITSARSNQCSVLPVAWVHSRYAPIQSKTSHHSGSYWWYYTLIYWQNMCPVSSIALRVWLDSPPVQSYSHVSFKYMLHNVRVVPYST